MSEKYLNPSFPYSIMKNREFQTNLQAKVFNGRSSGILLIKPKNKGFVGIGIKIFERRTFEAILLTEKGQHVNEQFMNAELVAKGTLKKAFFSWPMLVLMFLGKVGKATVSQIKDEILGSYGEFRWLEEINIITQKIEKITEQWRIS